MNVDVWLDRKPLEHHCNKPDSDSAGVGSRWQCRCGKVWLIVFDQTHRWHVWEPM